MASGVGPSRPRQRARQPDTTNDDDLNRRLAALLSLDEAEHLQRRHGRATTDADIALSLFAEEARSSIILSDDHALAQALQESEWQGTTNAQPSRLSSRTTFIRAPITPAPPARTPTQQVPVRNAAVNSGDNQTLGTRGLLGSLFSRIFSTFSAGLSASPSTTTPQTVSEPHRLSGHNCVICQDPIRGVDIRAPCGDHYDLPCLIDLFRAATRDESLFPPRCCRARIPMSIVRSHLPGDLVALLNEKEKEFGTLNRVYCANPTCSLFLGSTLDGFIWSTVTCTAPGCSTRTCRKCKQEVKGYIPHSCNTNAIDRDVLELAKSKNWARCPACGQMIELLHGCYHMSCRCKTEFCYLCTARWKTCKCAQWDEDRLLATAEQQVNHRLLAVQPPAYQTLLPAESLAMPRPPRNAVLPVETIVQSRRATFVPEPSTSNMNTRVHLARRHRDDNPGAGPGDLPPFPRDPPRPQSSFSPLAISAHHFPTIRSPNTTLTVAQTDPARRPTGDVPKLADPAESSRNRALQKRQQTPGRSISQPSAETHASSSKSVPLTRPEPKVATPRPNADDEAEQTLRAEAQKRIAERRRASRAATTSNNLVDSTRPKVVAHGDTKDRIADENARKQLMQDTIRTLRLNDNCAHKQWKFRQGGGRCDLCHHNLPGFLFRCTRCQTLVCARCRKNRL